MARVVALSWEALAARVPPLTTLAERAIYTGDAFNAQSFLRPFGAREADIQVTLYRDLFTWCPYCEKVRRSASLHT